MQLLTAVNLILPKLGEHEVMNLDTKHPTLAIILPLIEQKRREVLSRGWWFNTYPYTAYPDREGEVGVPINTVSFLADEEGIVTRGSRFYDTREHTYKFTKPVKGILVEDVEFDELPESVATFVFYDALVAAYLTDIGLEQIIQQWQLSAQQSEAVATAEHLRNKRYSTKKSRRWRRYQGALRG